MSVVTATILSDGSPIKDTYEVLSIDVRREVDRIPAATLVLLDGNPAEGTFAISETEVFRPGKEIAIKLRYEGEPGSEGTVFKGLVVRHGIEANASASLLNIELKDAAVRLTQGRRSQVFARKSDTDAIRTLLSNAKLTVGDLEATQPTHPELVQYQCSDWDFILSRTDLYGLRVVVEDGRVSARKVKASGLSVRRIAYAQDEVYDFEMQADAASQRPDFAVLGWDPATQKPRKVDRATPFQAGGGNFDAGRIATSLGFSKDSLAHAVPVAEDELKVSANGRMVRNRLAFIRGRIGVPGFAKARLLDIVELVGMGRRFNGKAVVTGLRHRVDASGWRTDLQFGLTPRRFCEEEGIREIPAAGFLPAASGLQIAVVKKIAPDPDKQLRVQVQLAGMEDAKALIWARWASPDAGKDRGWFFWPEVNDEVVVGFCNDDPRQPIVLGALFSSKNPPSSAFKNFDDKNKVKGIVTKKGTKFTFVDEDKPSVRIETPGGNKVVLDDQTGSIQLADPHGNTVTMDKTGITLKSAKDLNLDAGGNVTIKSTGNLQLEASGKVTLKGAAVDVQ